MSRSTRGTADAFPQLEAFFCGYLHQDYPDAHGDVASAVRAFGRDARRAERAAVKREWKAFRAATDGQTLRAIADQISRGLGAAWAPRRWADLEALDRLISDL